MSKNNRTRFHARYGERFLSAWSRYSISGLYGNQAEFEYYRTSRDTRVAPTQEIYFGGLVIIQKRGRHVTQKELSAAQSLLETLRINDCGEWEDPRQFCRIGNQVLLVDYGSTEVRAALHRTTCKS